MSKIEKFVILVLGLLCLSFLGQIAGAPPESRGATPVAAQAAPATDKPMAGQAALAVATGTAAQAATKIVQGYASVTDGDTVVVDGVTIRLKGVDAPESATRHGQDATEGMRRVVGNWLRCELTGERTHGREVGYCVNTAGRDIGQEIVSRGLALACPFFSDRYIAFERPDAIKRLTRASYCLKLAAQALPAAPQPRPPTAQAPVRRERPRLTCMSPDDLDSAGRRCGGRAASVRPGGR